MTRATPIPDTVTLHVPFRIVKRGGRKEMQMPDRASRCETGRGASQSRGFERHGSCCDLDTPSQHLTGQTAEAVDAGFLDELVPADQVEARAIERARELGTRLDAKAYAGTKRAIRAGVLEGNRYLTGS